jgi:hypothetical protein
MLSSNIKSLRVFLFFLIFISISLYTHTNYFFAYQFLAIYCSLFGFYISKLSFLPTNSYQNHPYINESIHMTLKSPIIHIEYIRVAFIENTLYHKISLFRLKTNITTSE